MGIGALAAGRSWVGIGLGLLAMLALSCSHVAQAAAGPWLLTLLDGDAVVVDGVKRSPAAAGLELSAGALIETGEQTALLRLEGPDQSSIDLGPGTRAMLSPPAQASRGGRVPVLYLLRGWAKLTSRGTAQIAGFVAPGLEGGNFNGAIVLRVAPAEQSVFAEAARIDLAERRTGGAPLKLAPGEFYRGDGSKPGSLAPRADAAWLKELPRAFRDTLPLRAASFKDRKPATGAQPASPALSAPSYEQLAHWLAAEPYVRRDFTQRFAPLLRDAAFRRGVQQHLKSHPEWASVLYPKEAPR